MSMVRLVDRAVQHWLALANAAIAVFVALPFVAPALLHLGHPGLANAIYAAYQLTCHEWATRSYFLFGPQATYSLAELQAHGVTNLAAFRGAPELGFKVAFCQRNVAIYGSALLAGLVYARWRSSPPLGFGGYLLAMLPMALDGFTQLFGWRESSWELRTLTGALFGAASVWLLYPRLDRCLAGRKAVATVPTASGR